MAGEWEKTRLGELIKVVHGWPFKSECFSPKRLGRPVVVAIGNFQYTGGFRFESTNVKEYADEYPKEYELASGDLLLVMTCQTSGGEILGVPGRIPADGNVYLHNQRLGKVVVKDATRADVGFLYYLALWNEFNRELFLSATGTKILHTAPGRIEAFEFGCPPLAEQKAIASVLGALDDKIELNRRMNATLEAMARALFQSWFVDFDPVRAKMDGRHPVGMDEATAALFPSSFEESGPQKIPAGWTRASLGSLVTSMSGGTPSKSNAALWGGQLPWISPKVMTSLHADEADDFVHPAAVGQGTRIAPIGSTLIMVRGMGLHKEVRVSQVRADVTFNQDVKALVPRGIAPALLLFALLNAQQELLTRVESSGHGTGILPTEILLGYPLVMPPLSVQRKLAVAFDALNDRIAAARAESRTLATLRDTLLPKLLSGELSVDGFAKEASL